MNSSDDQPRVALVRPYALTAGRTRPSGGVTMDTLVRTSDRGRAKVRSGFLHREELYVLRMCDQRHRSVAEIAAVLGIPLGVVRVLVADMAAEQTLVTNTPAPMTASQKYGPEVLRALRRLAPDRPQ